jgi:hypothetical protein
MRMLVVICLFVMTVIARPATDPAGEEFFEKSIRPLFIEHCHECHSASSKKLKGGLKLDTREEVLKGGDSGPALVPGDPDKSLIIKAVRWSDPDMEMPPKNKLKPEQIAALEKWVAMSAPHTGKSAAVASGDSPASKTNHWAYQPVRAPKVPELKNKSWSKTDIDRFVLAKLETKALQPSPDAERRVLIRRLYFNLLGLPPPPEVLLSKDESYEQVVDRLLASPQFGEHWGRHWLDVARFAESVTLRGFIFKEAWRYRDYVIESFNSDRPFSEFIKEQIAGDLMDGETVAERQRRLVATSFLAIGNWNLEEQDKKALEMDVVDEQLDTIGKAFLGQTIGCARCHDHKFDPIPTHDYYAMAGILRNARTLTHANVSAWIERPLPVEPALEAILREHEKKVAVVEAALKAAKTNLTTVLASIAKPLDFPGVIVDSAQAKKVGAWQNSTHIKYYIGDGYLHDQEKNKGEKSLTFTPELPRAGRYEVRFAFSHAASRATNVPVTVFHAQGETLVHVNQQDTPAFDGRFVSLGQFHFETNGFAYVLVGTEDTKGFVTADAVQFLPAEPSSDEGKIANVTPREDKVAARVKELEAELKTLKDTGPKRIMVASVKEADQVEDLPVHIRGSVHNLGAKVPRGFLTVVHRAETPTLPSDQSGRLEFAEWIASDDNPLTARVIVNRVWCWLMGEGLVRSVDNLGTTGDAPSHPELLDHLATQFMREGWSIKKLAREIVMSRTYQLSSRGTPKAIAADPENHLYSRANRRRLTAEEIRDAMLTVSGQLKLEIGGRTFPQDRAADYGFEYTDARRSIYVPVFRNALPEMFEAFDFAPPTMVVGKRSKSTVPTQALFLLNHPFVREQAKTAAARLKSEADPITKAYRLALGRAPTAAEHQIATRHLLEGDGLADLFHALFASVEFRYID